MGSIDQELREEVENALDQEFEWMEIQEGLNDIYRIVSEQNEYVLKVHTNKHHSSVSYRKNQKARFRAESKLYQLVSAIENVASPEIIYEDFSEKQYEHGFYIMQKLDGENLEDVANKVSEDQLKHIIYQYGQILGRIHRETSFQEYGLILSRESKLEMLKSSDNWRDSFGDMLENLEELIEERWDEKPDLHLSEIRKGLDVVPEKPGAVLLHSDNRLENILVKDSEITGFLDWSFCRAGHGMYDLVRAEYLLIDYDLDHLDDNLREKLREKLLEGYREQNSLSEDYFGGLRSLYRYMTVLWIIAGFPNWSSDWDQDRRAEFADDLKRRLRQEL